MSDAIKKFKWMNLDDVLRAVPAMIDQNVSEVARGKKKSSQSKEGFVQAYIATDGDPERMAERYTGWGDQTWAERRLTFIRRHLRQMRQNDSHSDGWDGNQPTRRHLGLIAWAYTPSPKKTALWLKTQPSLNTDEWKDGVKLSKKNPKTISVAMHKLSSEGVHEKIGKVLISETQDGLQFDVDVSGLNRGKHGFHIHEYGDIEPAEKDGKMTAGLAAGQHYDPDNTGEHLGPYEDGHLGDLPYLIADRNGNISESVVAPRLSSLSEIEGLSLIIHSHGDNYSDYPLPNGGGKSRAVGGVITNSCPYCVKNNPRKDIPVKIYTRESRAYRERHPWMKSGYVGKFLDHIKLYRVVDQNEYDIINQTGEIIGGDFSDDAELEYGASWGEDLDEVIKFGKGWKERNRLKGDLYVLEIDGKGKKFAKIAESEFDLRQDEILNLNSDIVDWKDICSTGIGCSIKATINDVVNVFKLTDNDLSSWNLNSNQCSINFAKNNPRKNKMAAGYQSYAWTTQDWRSVFIHRDGSVSFDKKCGAKGTRLKSGKPRLCLPVSVIEELLETQKGTDILIEQARKKQRAKKGQRVPWNPVIKDLHRRLEKKTVKDDPSKKKRKNPAPVFELSADIVPIADMNDKRWFISENHSTIYYHCERLDVDTEIHPDIIKTVDPHLKNLVRFFHDRDIQTGASCQGHEETIFDVSERFMALEEDADKIRNEGLVVTDLESGEEFIWQDSDYEMPFDSFDEAIEKFTHHSIKGALTVYLTDFDLEALMELEPQINDIGIEVQHVGDLEDGRYEYMLFAESQSEDEQADKWKELTNFLLQSLE